VPTAASVEGEPARGGVPTAARVEGEPAHGGLPTAANVDGERARSGAAGPPVVFVHGLLVSATLWTRAADALAARGVRSYAPDLPLGSHRVALGDRADQTPRGVARQLAAFLEALDLRDVTLVGNDTGGAICQFLLDTDPSRIGRVVLTNCDSFEDFPPAPVVPLFKLLRRPGRIRAALAPIRVTAVRHSRAGYGMLTTTELDPEQTREWIEPCLTDAGVRDDVARFARAVDPQELVDVGARLRTFDGPVLLAWGTSDQIFKLASAERLRDAFADARLVPIDGSSTFVALDATERLADEIAAFQRAAAAVHAT
jgi:pimeloyl-ACP methyl ester carboxylesterase